MGRTQGKNAGRTCQGKKTDGSSCTAYALRDSDLCRVHDPRTRDEALRTLQEGKARWLANPNRSSQKTKGRPWDLGKFLGRKPIDSILESVPAIQTQEDLMHFMCEVAPLVLSGRIPAERIPAMKMLLEGWAKLLARGVVPGPSLQGLFTEGVEEGPALETSRADPSEADNPVSREIAELEKKLGRPAILGDLDLDDESDDREQVGGDGDGVEPEGPRDPP